MAQQEKNARLSGPPPRNDSPYGQNPSREAAPAQVQSVPTGNSDIPAGEDPYAAYGGYQNYVALWYATQGKQPLPNLSAQS